MAAHRGASSTAKEFQNWDVGIQSPDSELTYELDTLKARSRDLERNSGTLSGLTQTYEDSIVGNQYKLRATPNYRLLGRDKAWANEWSLDVENRFNLWAGSVECDASRQRNLHGLVKMVIANALMYSGEALALPLWMPDRRTHTTIQLVDSDRLATPAGMVNDEFMRNGIKVNRYGEPITYYIATKVPFDFYSSVSIGSLEYEAIPARTRFGRRRVLHLFDLKRVGATRGKPILSSIIPAAKMLDTYQRYELKSAITQSMIAAFVESPMSPDQIASMFNGGFNEYETGRSMWKGELDGGSIIPLYPGDKMVPFTPSRSADAYSGFIETTLRDMAAGANIPYEAFFKDFSKTNYSSARAAILEAWRFYNGRKKWVADYFSNPIFDLWLEEDVNAGRTEAPGFYEFREAYTQCRWLTGGRGWVDEVKEAEAAGLRISMNLSTLEAENAEQGRDYRDTLEQKACELRLIKDLEEEYNISFSTAEAAPQAESEESEEGEESEEVEESEEDEDEGSDDADN